MSNQSGYVYLLKNEAMPGIYKIGMTNRSVEERVKELSLSTSIPLPFEVVCFASVENAKEAEEELHEEFAEFRISDNREFFKFTDEKLKCVIISFADYSYSKISDGIDEFDNAFGNNLVDKLIDISLRTWAVDGIYLPDEITGEYEYVACSELLSLLQLSFKQKERVCVPVATLMACSISEYKQVLKDVIEPDKLKKCIKRMDLQNDPFNLKELLED